MPIWTSSALLPPSSPSLPAYKTQTHAVQESSSSLPQALWDCQLWAHGTCHCQHICIARFLFFCLLYFSNPFLSFQASYGNGNPPNPHNNIHPSSHLQLAMQLPPHHVTKLHATLLHAMLPSIVASALPCLMRYAFLFSPTYFSNHSNFVGPIKFPTSHLPPHDATHHAMSHRSCQHAVLALQPDHNSMHSPDLSTMPHHAAALRYHTTMVQNLIVLPHHTTCLPSWDINASTTMSSKSCHQQCNKNDNDNNNDDNNNDLMTAMTP